MKQNINCFKELEQVCLDGRTISQIFQEQEAFLLGMEVSEVRNKVLKTLNAMKESIKSGLNSQEKSYSGLCGGDCTQLQAYYSNSGSLFGELYEKITTYALATIEENARMGKIVACPTAGSCGIVPSVIVAASEIFKADEEAQINALITAGAIGAIIANKVQPAGAVAGCQAECGVASAMAAGALCQLRNGTTEQILNAVALSLKNILGLTCDPVCGLVEIPCVKRNVFLAIHSITACELSLAGIKSLIPVDEVVDSLRQTGQLMSIMLKESSQAGLAKTETAMKFEKQLKINL